MDRESGLMRMRGGSKTQESRKRDGGLLLLHFILKMLFLKMTLSEHSHPCNFGKSTNDTL